MKTDTNRRHGQIAEGSGKAARERFQRFLDRLEAQRRLSVANDYLAA
jgi:hypothetical protein